MDQGFIYGTTVSSQDRKINEEGIYSGASSHVDTHIDNEHEHELERSKDSDSKYVKLGNLPEHNGLIRSVCWAPSMGRNYHLIATGCKDGFVRIFKATETSLGDLKIETLAKLSDHKLEVWRVNWNMTGTILSSAGDDGKLRLWKCNYLSEWKCMSVINTSNRSDNRTIEADPIKTK